MLDEDSMPTPCDRCDDIFDLPDGNPCHRCNIVFCRRCAQHYDGRGWLCERCFEVASGEAEQP